jgi:hypothetical protein
VGEKLKNIKGNLMSSGFDGSKIKKKPWKTRVERDIILHDDLKESGLQGGKIIGEKLAIFSFIIGIPMLAVGLYASFNMLFGFGFDINMATIILVLIVNTLGLLLIISGINIYRR